MSGIYSDNQLVKEIEDLEDVSLSSLADEEVLKYDSATRLWKNGTAGGGDPYVFYVNGTATGQMLRGGTVQTSGTNFTRHTIMWATTLPSPYNTNDSDLTGTNDQLWTCPSDGLYSIYADINIRANPNDKIWQIITYIRKNGKTDIANRIIDYGGDQVDETSRDIARVYVLEPLSAGDTIQIDMQVQITSGAWQLLTASQTPILEIKKIV
jgi:hypothetical protein